MRAFDAGYNTNFLCAAVSHSSLIASSSTTPADTPAVGFVSLGCAKALVDSERILTRLRSEGYALVGDYRDADLVVINTCGFIESARDESFDGINQALRAGTKVVVTGCLGADADSLRTRFPRLAGVTGPADCEAVMQLIHNHLPVPKQEDERFLELVPSGVKLTPRHYAYVKISEGCNHACSFCIIPSMRGRLVSRPLDQVMRECEQLVADGVRELLIVAQDTSAYGLDRHYAPSQWRGQSRPDRLETLAECLGELGVWVRLHYLYPYPHLSRLIPLMRDGLILPYLDMPLQHSDATILKAMRRPHAGERVLERLEQWRRLCPELTIRSTFIVGFPGETEVQFAGLLDFLRQARLDRVGAFAYSPVSGAAANALGPHIPASEQQARLAEFMRVQEEISRAKLNRKVGSSMQVMVDKHDTERSLLICRSKGDAPEVDGLVYVRHPAHKRDLPAPGSLLWVRVDHTDAHDCHAVFTRESLQ